MRYEVVMAIVSAAKKDLDIVLRNEEILDYVKERTLDKKVSFVISRFTCDYCKTELWINTISTNNNYLEILYNFKVHTLSYDCKHIKMKNWYCSYSLK